MLKDAYHHELLDQNNFVPLTKLNDVCLPKLRNVWIECWLPKSAAVRLNPNCYRLNAVHYRNQIPLVDDMLHVEV